MKKLTVDHFTPGPFCISVVALFTVIVYGLTSCSTKKETNMSHIQAYAVRLKPGEDLKKSIEQFVTAKQIKAGWISTCVGSLTQYNIRYANQAKGNTATGYFEIVGLTGTVSVNGSHLHISISDSTGKTIGGHLLEDNLVYTTAEIVIMTSTDFIFERTMDSTTPWKELQVTELRSN